MYHRYQFIHVNRLRHMVIHADRQRLFAVLGKGVRRHRDNRDVRLLRVAEPAYHLGRRVAVLYRHLNVHQNERIVPCRRFVQLFRAVHAVFRAVNDKSDLAQHRNRDFRVQVVVLREKNALAAQNTHIRAVLGFFRLRVLERREPARHMAKRTAKKTANSGVRFDDKRTRLKTGEIQRKNGTYEYRWTTRDGKRHSVYAPTLDKLREYEEQVIVDRHDGIKTDVKALSVNDVFDLWCNLKRGVKDSTMKNYIYMYEMFVRPTFGKKRLVTVKKSDVRGFYNRLADEKILKISTIDGIHNVLHQVFQVAVDDDYIRNNPTDNMLKELKQAHCMDSEKRKALTMEEEKIFLEYLMQKPKYRHWYPVFYIMANTGMRVGEITGLRWRDIDFDEGLISVNHTLVYYNHRDEHGCYYSINTPKTKAGERTIPMTDQVKNAFQMGREYQEEVGISSIDRIDGYDDFVFVNRFGMVQSQSTLNTAIKRIMRDCNGEILDNAVPGKEPTLLPDFSCHSLRHTFATRLCESGTNIKVIQDVLGHADVSTTMNIYVDVTNELKKNELKSFSAYMEGA